MKIGRLFTFTVMLGLLAALATACRSPQVVGSGASTPPAELVQPTYLYEVTRHLYRWYLDESEVGQVTRQKQFVFWVRQLHPRLDPGDQSLLGEIILPQLGVTLRVKKADYRIEELNTTIQSQSFKITQVTRLKAPDVAPANCTVVTVDTQEMVDYLFRTRSQRDYPDAALMDRMRAALRQELIREGMATNAASTQQVVHFSPLSPVANEVWVYWETGRKLLHFASDIDLANPAVWQQESLMVKVFDLDQQVVLSHEEAPGSNRFLTRHQVGRVLFNCLVLGQRVAVPAPAAPISPGP